jgi:hypothetical protein
MEHYLAYMASFDPGFPARIRGATGEQIAELERLAAMPLPHSYRAFLERMGLNDGGLHIAFEGTTAITEILDYYRTEVLTGERKLPRESLLIGVGAISIPDIALDCRGPGEPPVVFTDGDQFAGLYAKSLEKLLFQTAFAKYRLAVYPWEATYSSSYNEIGKRHLTDVACSVAQACGLQRAGFSDRIACCAEKSDVAAYISQYEGQGIAVAIAGQDRHEVSRIGSEMVRQVGVRLVEWKDRSGTP